MTTASLTVLTEKECLMLIALIRVEESRMHELIWHRSNDKATVRLARIQYEYTKELAALKDKLTMMADRGKC